MSQKTLVVHSHSQLQRAVSSFTTTYPQLRQSLPIETWSPNREFLRLAVTKTVLTDIRIRKQSEVPGENAQQIPFPRRRRENRYRLDAYNHLHGRHVGEHLQAVERPLLYLLFPGEPPTANARDGTAYQVRCNVSSCVSYGNAASSVRLHHVLTIPVLHVYLFLTRLCVGKVSRSLLRYGIPSKRRI